MSLFISNSNSNSISNSSSNSNSISNSSSNSNSISMSNSSSNSSSNSNSNSISNFTNSLLNSSSSPGILNSNLSANTSGNIGDMSGSLGINMSASMNSNGTMSMSNSLSGTSMTMTKPIGPTVTISGSSSSSGSGMSFNIWGDGAIDRSGRINPDAPTYTLIHGYNNTGGNASNGYQPAQWMADQAQILRQRESNANIILVDWEKGAGNPLYYPSADKTPEVGNQLATFLINNNVNPNYTNIIGHSLGAQVAGFAGSAYRQSTGNSLAEIVGLDPAGPSFEGKGASDRLDPTDANRVVALHTSIVLGYNDPLATLDVYANKQDLLQPGQTDFRGNHSYATTLFTELLQGNNFSQSSGTPLNLNTIVNGGLVGVNNVSTKNNKNISPLNLLGTLSNDSLAGGADNDTIRGRGGNDYISGGDGNDSLWGEAGNDLLYGGRGNDSILGGRGSDRLFGDSGNDVLTGADPKSGRGLREIDQLTGGSGSDRFVLGTTQGAFYSDRNLNTSGLSDYALITDFNPLEDTIQLSGSLAQYSLGSAPSSLGLAGTAIFLNERSPELVAIVQGSSNLSLSSNYFVTV